MCHPIRHWNQVGFRAKADFASGPAANGLERLIQGRHELANSPSQVLCDMLF